MRQVDAVPFTARAMQKARRLSALSIGWMTVEATVAIGGAAVAGSVALLGFGLDSLIELGSAATILWLYTGARAGSQEAERRAQQVIAGCLALLALYLTVASATAFAAGGHAPTSWVGVAVTAAALVVMPVLARAKHAVAMQLGSAATAGDAAQSWVCALGAAAALLSLIAGALAGWSWVDPAAGLAIAALAAQESRTTWRGEVCADCAPVGLHAPAGARCDHDCC